MATQSIIFNYPSCISSCRPGETELQQGEEVILELKAKNPLWPAYVKATVAMVTASTSGRQYTFDYEEDDLNGGPTIEDCDISEICCYSCCDAITERLNNLISVLPVTENEDGTFSLDGQIT